MLVFDTLSELESYEGAIPGIRKAIDVMDRSLPYEEGDGVHHPPEDGDSTYIIDSFMTSKNGFDGTYYDSAVMEIVLEGSEIVSVSGSVFRLETGRFLIYDSKDVKRGMMYTLPERTKAVRFILK